MAIQRFEIITSVSVILLLGVIFILNSVKLLSNYLGISIFSTLIYFTVCYLYINRISATKWKILVAALSVGLIAVIFSFHFFIKPWKWKFVSSQICGITTVALEAFLLKNFTNDRRSLILFTAFVADVVILFKNLQDSEQFNKIYTIILSIIVYIILSAFHVKQMLDQLWKVAAIALAFFAVLVLVILISFFWSNKEMLFILIASINACLSFVPWLWIMFVPKIKAWWKAYHQQETIQGEKFNFLEIPGLPTMFTTKDLEAATGNFQVQSLIGEGASGSVFKGTLADGTCIAVKRIKWQPSGEMEFRTEITVIASLQHVNLVRLLGYSLSTSGDHYLIYPFFEKGSLDAWLFKDDNKRSHLTWVIRYNIAIDVAKALAYLHHECHHRILHLDIKPANILLDGNFRALLSDFGMSKLIGRDESTVMTRARGTVGYLAPEMLVPNAISTKSDVYSYGMVVLELVGGRRNFMLEMGSSDSQQRQNLYFPATVRERMMQDQLMEVVDESLVKSGEIREEEVVALARVGLWCIQENPTLRPSMTEVVEMLEGRKPVDVPPESSMFMMNLLESQMSANNLSISTGESALMSANNLSISIQSGR